MSKANNPSTNQRTKSIIWSITLALCTGFSGAASAETCADAIKQLITQPTDSLCEAFYGMTKAQEVVILWSSWEKYQLNKDKTNMEGASAALATAWKIKTLGMSPFGVRQLDKAGKAGSLKCTDRAGWAAGSEGYIKCAKHLKIKNLVFLAVGAPGEIVLDDGATNVNEQSTSYFCTNEKPTVDTMKSSTLSGIFTQAGFDACKKSTVKKCIGSVGKHNGAATFKTHKKKILTPADYCNFKWD